MPITISEHDAITYPWLGLGIGWDAETKDIQPLSLSEQQWHLLFSRVDYMQPSWIRSMINVGWFCPTGIMGTYSFDTAEMRAWYPILDYAKAHHIPVMLGTWDTTPWSFHSEGYATVLADLVQYLVRQRGYTNIRYLNSLNEPDTKVPDFNVWREGARNIQAILAQRGLSSQVSLVGPDTSWTNGWITQSDLPWNDSSFLGAYEWHDYERTCCDIQSGQVENSFSPIVRRLAGSGQLNPKPVMLGEIGWGYQIGPGDNQYHVKDYQYGVEMADFAIQLARAGVSGAAAWNLDDAMHNKVWGMWNIVDEPALRPWFYAWSLLSRSFPAGATLYKPASPDPYLRLLAARIAGSQDPDQPGWSVAMINRASSPANVELVFPPARGAKPFNSYVYSEQTISTNRGMVPLPFAQTLTPSGSALRVQVPANGLLLITNLQEKR